MSAYLPFRLLFPIFLFSSLVLTTCADLSFLLPGKVFLPDTSTYNVSISSYFFLGERLSPTCIVQPTTAEDVAKIFRAFGSNTRNNVALRSGGHSPNPGFANTDHGFTIDLRGLNEITLQDINAVSVGTGALWIDVYKALEPLNLTAVGSRVASVGVGGFITGGGLSFFSPRYGFSCDNVQNMQVVLANGTIINANATSNSRLFRALKGGQSNFGVITSFDIITYPQSEFWGGAIQYPASADAAQLSAFTAFKMSPYDGFAEIEQTYVYFGPLDTFSSTNNMVYTMPVVNASGLHYFTEVQPQTLNTMRISRASDFAEEIEILQPTEQFGIYSTLSFPISADILPKVHALWRNATISLASSEPNITSVLTFQSIPPPPAETSLGNSFPFTSDSTPQNNIVLMLLSIYWPDTADSALIESAVKILTASVQQLVGEEVKFKYLNYAAAWQDPFGGYGEASMAELREVAQLYDPNGFFQKVVSGGFKLDIENI